MDCSANHRRNRCRSPATWFLLFQLLLISSVFIVPSTACSNSNCQLLEPCSADTDCGPTLYCGNCPATGKNQSVCIRSQAVIPTSIIDGLPFNKYTWLVTHNAFSIVDAPLISGPVRITFYNQEDSVTNQLANGVRGLMLDMYDFANDIWLCHSYRGRCYNMTAFQPAINTLREVEAFLSANPTEIVTIMIEDYVHTPKGLANLFVNAGLAKYMYPVSKMPKKGKDWPTVTEMAKRNHRLLVFTTDPSKEKAEGIAYQWRYMAETEYGNAGVIPGSCQNRKESEPLDSKSVSLILQNFFPTIPNQFDACKEHSAPLTDMVGTCYEAAGNVMPNFLAVDFYLRSEGGGVFDAIDLMNAQTLCGSNSLKACQVSGGDQSHQSRKRNIRYWYQTRKKQLMKAVI